MANLILTCKYCIATLYISAQLCFDSPYGFVKIELLPPPRPLVFLEIAHFLCTTGIIISQNSTFIVKPSKAPPPPPPLLILITYQCFCPPAFLFILQELMMRKKAVQNLDSRQLTLIENAFFYCNPPDRQKVLIWHVLHHATN